MFSSACHNTLSIHFCSLIHWFLFLVLLPCTQVVSGLNVYAIVRARRTASTEALVFSVPLRAAANKVKPATGGGIALALALAQEFRRKLLTHSVCAC